MESAPPRSPGLGSGLVSVALLLALILVDLLPLVEPLGHPLPVEPGPALVGDRPMSFDRMTTVCGAARDLPAGTLLEPDMLQASAFPLESVIRLDVLAPGRAVYRRPEELVGSRLAMDVRAGTPFMGIHLE